MAPTSTESPLPQLRKSGRTPGRVHPHEDSEERDVPPKKREKVRPETRALLNKIDKQYQKALKEKEEKERKAEEAAVEQNDPTTDDEESDNSFDVSNLKFAVPFLVKFDGHQCFSHAYEFKLGECRYQTLNQTAITRVAKAVGKKNSLYEFSSADATLAAVRVPKGMQISFELEDQDTWDEVERFVRKWMDEGKMGIQARVVFTFNKLKDEDSTNMMTEKPSDSARASRKVHINAYHLIDILDYNSEAPC